MDTVTDNPKPSRSADLYVEDCNIGNYAIDAKTGKLVQIRPSKKYFWRASKKLDDIINGDKPERVK